MLHPQKLNTNFGSSQTDSAEEKTESFRREVARSVFHPQKLNTNFGSSQADSAEEKTESFRREVARSVLQTIKTK